MPIQQRLTPFLWFDDNAEQAVEFYTSVFRDSRIVTRSRYGEGGPRPKGSVLVIAFKLEDQDFLALNGGPQFKLSEAFSIFVNCETQQELDTLWDKFLADGAEVHECGWLKDRYGLSWQINYAGLQDMMTDSDLDRAARVMNAILQMKKIDIQRLKEAYDGR